jgi:hypothetical protein
MNFYNVVSGGTYCYSWFYTAEQHDRNVPTAHFCMYERTVKLTGMKDFPQSGDVVYCTEYVCIHKTVSANKGQFNNATVLRFK